MRKEESGGLLAATPDRHMTAGYGKRVILKQNWPGDCQHTSNYLIGDEGFACSSTLLTIVRSAEVGKITDPEFLTKVKAYNRALKKARVRIEHTFGCLKKRWPALLYKKRSSKIANNQAIILSAVVLHKFLLQDLDPISNIPDDEFERQIAEMRMDNINSLRRGQYRVRNHVIHTFF